MATASTTLTNLESAVAQLLTNAKQNRSTLNEKWLANYKAFSCTFDRDDKTWKRKETEKTWKSQTFIDITRQKITAAVSLTTDILFKGGRVPFMLEPDTRSASLARTDPLVTGAAIEENEELIHKQFDSCNAIGELKRAIIFGATYGEMWVKTYTGEMVERWWDEPEANVLVKVERRSRSKQFEARSPWDMWFDLETGDTQAMEYIFERRMMTVAQLRGYSGRGAPFIDSALREVVSQAPLTDNGSTSGNVQDSNSMSPGMREITYRNKPLEAFEVWCRVSREDADAFEREVFPVSVQDVAAATQASMPMVPSDAEVQEPTLADAGGIGAESAPALGSDDFGNKESDKVEIFCITLGGRIVAYQRDPGPRPYFRAVWEENIDGIGGRSVADNLEDIQRTLNGAVRSFENNTKLIANLIIAVKRRLIENKNLNDAISEGGVVELNEECDNIQQALQQVVFQDITAPLLKSIELFMSFADLASNLPRAEQGQQSENAQTAYELQQRLDRSGKYLASIVRNIDALLKWIVEQFYADNAANPDLQVTKIPATVKSLGFTSFENRFLRVQRLMQMLTMALQSPQLAAITKIKWLWEEIGKAQDLEADQFIKSDDEIMAEQQQALQSQIGSDAGAVEKAAAPKADSPEDQVLKAAKAEQAKADADKKRTEAAVLLGRAQNEAAMKQAAIEDRMTRMTGLQTDGLMVPDHKPMNPKGPRM